MKTIFIVLTIVLIVFGAYWYYKQPEWLKREGTDNKKAVISLAELKMDQLAESKDNDSAALSDFKRMRELDKDMYLEFYKEGGSVKKGFYIARPGSCCPCAAGGMRCCECVGGSGLAAIKDMVSVALPSVGYESSGGIFKLTSNTQDQKVYQPLQPEKKTIDNMDIFLIEATEGNYVVSFTGDITITLYITVYANGEFTVDEKM